MAKRWHDRIIDALKPASLHSDHAIAFACDQFVDVIENSPQSFSSAIRARPSCQLLAQ